MIPQPYSEVPARTHLMPCRVVYAPFAPVPHQCLFPAYPLLPSLPGLFLMTPDPRDLFLNVLKMLLFLISSQRLLLESLTLQSQHKHPIPVPLLPGNPVPSSPLILPPRDLPAMLWLWSQSLPIPILFYLVTSSCCSPGADPLERLR